MILNQKSYTALEFHILSLSCFFLTGPQSLCASVLLSQHRYGPVGLIRLDSLGCAILIFNLQASYKPSATRKRERKAKTINHSNSEYRYTVRVYYYKKIGKYICQCKKIVSSIKVKWDEVGPNVLTFVFKMRNVRVMCSMYIIRMYCMCVLISHDFKKDILYYWRASFNSFILSIFCIISMYKLYYSINHSSASWKEVYFWLNLTMIK